MSEINAPNVVINNLDFDDYERLSLQYSLDFDKAKESDFSEFNRKKDIMLSTVLSSTGPVQDLGINPLPVIEIYRPSRFLSDRLDSAQVQKINENETQAVARYCLDIQNQLKKVPIIETYSKMGLISESLEKRGLHATFSEIGFHDACGEWAGKNRQFWARQEVCDRLVAFVGLLGSIGLTLHFEDAFRPPGVQEGLFKRRVQWTIAAHPDWNEDQIVAEAQSKTAVSPRLASHKAGAAIDARLRDLETHKILDFGHDYPDGGAVVFPKTPFVTADQWRNRNLFKLAANLSGLTLYVGEDWHVSYGDNLASLDENEHVSKGYAAKFGPIKEFDRQTGEIISTYSQVDMDKIFDF